jgi:hypothetical protein
VQAEVLAEAAENLEDESVISYGIFVSSHGNENQNTGFKRWVNVPF